MKISRTVLGILLAALFAGSIYLSGAAVSGWIQKGQRVSFLVLGVDELKHGRHADVILLFSYEPKTRLLDIISIPRDTLAGSSGRMPRKLSEVFYLNLRKQKDVEKTMRDFSRTVSAAVGLPVDFYMVISYRAFIRMIDLMGGTEVVVEKEMHYDDNWGNLHIHFPEGAHHLNGDEALKYIRFRHTPTGDRGRIVRQQDFIKDLIRKAFSVREVPKVPEFFRIVKEEVFTDLKPADFFVLASEAAGFDLKSIRMHVLPGEPRLIKGKDFFIIDEERKEEIMDIVRNSQMVTWPRQRRDRVLPVRLEDEEQLIVEVWNASGRQGMAEQLSRYLRHYGVDVIEWGN
ncbi:MAG TPA: LCP family protein, partial [bacterium]|nr:LCP family protein [bacterium]